MAIWWTESNCKQYGILRLRSNEANMQIQDNNIRSKRENMQIQQLQFELRKEEEKLSLQKEGVSIEGSVYQTASELQNHLFLPRHLL